jgi:hypothetical protein
MSARSEDTSGAIVSFELPAQATAGNTGTTVWTTSVPFDGRVARVDIVPRGAVTANGTNFATYTLQNLGPQGSGSTVVATRAWSATNSVAGTKEQATLSGTAANLEVKAGDILQLVRSVGGSGLATPAMSWLVNILAR